MGSSKSSLLIAVLLLVADNIITTANGLSISRRRYLQWQTTGGCIATAAAAASTAVLSNPSVAQAANLKSRTEGYAVQHTEREWAVSRYNIWLQCRCADILDDACSSDVLSLTIHFCCLQLHIYSVTPLIISSLSYQSIMPLMHIHFL